MNGTEPLPILRWPRRRKILHFFTVESARSNVQQGQDNLNRTSIFAPMSGTISKLAVELGERVVGTAQMAGNGDCTRGGSFEYGG